MTIDAITTSAVGRGSRAGLGAMRRPLAWLVAWGALLALWQVLAAALGPELLPGLGAIVTQGLPEVLALDYHSTLLTSMSQMLVGFAIAAAVTIPLGALMGASRVWNDLLQPYAYGIYVTPREALLPLLIILFGTDASFRIAIVILFSAFFPLVNTAAGVSEVARGPLAELARSMCTSRWHYFASVLVPGALPYVVAGVRLGLGMAFNGIVIAELWTSVGAGGALTSLASYRQLPEYFALAGLVAVLAITSYSLLGALERHLKVRFGQP
jgi:ABC-type nitrate/sulfonate/bicarbonate transport system permease component